jgi:methylase of polypeptide subunit release factors
MQHIIEVDGRKIDLYFDESVYSPEHTDIGTVLLADKLIKDGKKLDIKVLDVGCGSGILGLSIKKMHPFSNVILCDISSEAVEVTKRNAEGLNVSVIRCDLLPKLGTWDIIVSNLPTFDKEQMKSETLYGPKIAYKGGKEPLQLYERLFKEARSRTRAIICECQPKYQIEFQLLAIKHGWKQILSSGDSFAFF